MRMFIAGVMLLVATGCVIGPRPSGHQLARSPGGADIQLDLSEPAARLRGELVAVTDSSILVAADGRLYQVTYRRIEGATVRPWVDNVRLGRRRALPDDERGRLALRSRYPQGLSPSLMRSLLEAYGQQAPLVPGAAS